MKDERGFTLLELLMVVIIIGILAALALPAYYRAVGRSRSAEAITVLGQLRSASQRACIDTGNPPTGFGDLDIEDPNTVPNAAWSYTFTATTCNPLAFNGTASLTAAVPCSGSTVAMDDPPINPTGSPYTYTWIAPC